MKGALVYGIPANSDEVIVVRRIRVPANMTEVQMMELKLNIESMLGVRNVRIVVE